MPTDTNGSGRRLFTAKEASLEFGLGSPKFLLDAARRGELRAVRLSRKMVRFRAEDVDDWIRRYVR